MKAPYNWLKTLVPDAPPIAEAAQLLLTSGTAVETVQTFGVADSENGGGDNFRIGRVIEFEQHPDADRLRLCKVDVGGDEPQQIICGASNFQAGDTVAVVLPGGTMPDGMKIKKAKLRGVESRGMMLSERELGLSTDHSGIMVLPAEWSPGEPLNNKVPLGDEVLHLEITSNRPDCLSMMGIARELATASGASYTEDQLWPKMSSKAPTEDQTQRIEDVVKVSLEADDLCPRYMARAFTNLTVGPSPHWLKSRLAAAGMRTINNVVDVTNYVMLLTGQPLHAFDADRIDGKHIIVRRAKAGEKVTTLDDVERTLDNSMLSIADESGTAVIAGIMGADRVEVTDATTSIVLEAACFDGPSIQRTSRKIGVRSESSGRFEKNLDPHMPAVALDLATRLYAELCDATWVTGTIDSQSSEGIPVPPTIEFDIAQVERVVGITVPASEMATTLQSLGYSVLADDDTIVVSSTGASTHASHMRVGVPHWRMFDTTRTIDLVEEIARFRLDQVPSKLPRRESQGATLTSQQHLQRTLEDLAMGMGLHEVVTYSLAAAGSGERAGRKPAEVAVLANPMTEDHVELRADMIESHLEVVQRNRAVGVADIAIFETGHVFATTEPGAVDGTGLPRFARERSVISGVCTGELFGQRWDSPGVPTDFAAVSGIVSSLVAATGHSAELVVSSSPSPWMHPGQSADVTVGGEAIGWVATLHPGAAKPYVGEQVAVAFELDIEQLSQAAGALTQYSAVSEYPAVVEDIAVIVPATTVAGELLATARKGGGELLESVNVFDRYEGESIGEGKYSLALRMRYRAPDRTLTDIEATEIRTQVVDALAQAHQAVLRDH